MGAIGEGPLVEGVGSGDNKDVAEPNSGSLTTGIADGMRSAESFSATAAATTATSAVLRTTLFAGCCCCCSKSSWLLPSSSSPASSSSSSSSSSASEPLSSSAPLVSTPSIPAARSEDDADCCGPIAVFVAAEAPFLGAVLLALSSSSSLSAGRSNVIGVGGSSTNGLSGTGGCNGARCCCGSRSRSPLLVRLAAAPAVASATEGLLFGLGVTLGTKIERNDSVTEFAGGGGGDDDTTIEPTLFESVSLPFPEGRRALRSWDGDAGLAWASEDIVMAGFLNVCVWEEEENDEDELMPMLWKNDLEAGRACDSTGVEVEADDGATKKVDEDESSEPNLSGLKILVMGLSRLRGSESAAGVVVAVVVVAVAVVEGPEIVVVVVVVVVVVGVASWLTEMAEKAFLTSLNVLVRMFLLPPSVTHNRSSGRVPGGGACFCGSLKLSKAFLSSLGTLGAPLLAAFLSELLPTSLVELR